MPVVKIALDENHYTLLKQMADDADMSVQELIKSKVFNEKRIFTPEDAVRRIQEGDWDGKEFELPDIYGEDWTLDRGPAGVFGKSFYHYITKYPDLGIKFKEMGPRRALYTYRKPR